MRAKTVLLVPAAAPREVQEEPFHWAIRLMVLPPMVVKEPPATRYVVPLYVHVVSASISPLHPEKSAVIFRVEFAALNVPPVTVKF